MEKLGLHMKTRYIPPPQRAKHTLNQICHTVKVVYISYGDCHEYKFIEYLMDCKIW